MDNMNLFGEPNVNEVTYDKPFKRLFSRKAILAVILSNIIPEYKNLPLSEIEDLIVTDKNDSKRAALGNLEDIGFRKTIEYDIVIQCTIPGKGLASVNLYFDLEMQRSFRPGYSIVQRAIYYAGRLLSSQLEESKNYSDLVPVYSTWICLDKVPQPLQNSVYSFRMSGINNKGIVDKGMEAEAQLINIDLLLLSVDYDWDVDDNDLVKFLQAIFKNRLSDV